jgi:hypothetical protein
MTVRGRVNAKETAARAANEAVEAAEG